jgi:hypothetical protein
LIARACNTRAQGIEILKRSATATPVVDVLTYWGRRGWLARDRPCPMATMYDARQTLEITLAIEESARTGQSVRLAR